MSKRQYIHQGGWVKNLALCVETYNNYANSSTGFTPKQALEMNEEKQKELRKKVEESHGVRGRT